MAFLNLHHLRYFRVAAQELNLTRAAAKLNLSVPALSVQLRQLEHNLGHPLFDRCRGGWTLTEAGRLALEYAETITRAGDELVDVLAHRPRADRQFLRAGVVATLSRNFLLEFIRPALHREGVGVVLRSGGLRDLLVLLHAHQVDLVLSNQPARRDAETPWHSHLPDDFGSVPMILPSQESNTRAGFDLLLAASGIRPRIIAEVDDMATLRLLAREGEGLALVPPVVVRDEIEAGTLIEMHRLTQVRETFYAITPSRRFPNPLVAELVGRMHPQPQRRRAIKRAP
jgi:LysR family transcriptional activator of nhaA